ncbi:MAG TPA: type II toxin-antitoxin system HicB family antitoxin [Mycobacteriales bacterium]|nr:type II toxin-antitoxin system HicB family antitoxin [Mycobacteriales bacterium]
MRDRAMQNKFTLKISEDTDGMLWAQVEDLPGCFASGQNLDTLMEAAAEAIGLYLSEEGPEIRVGLTPLPEPDDSRVLSLGRRRREPERKHESVAPTAHYSVDSAELLIEA